MKMKVCCLIALTILASWVSLLFTPTVQATSDYDNITLSGGQPRVISSQCNINENVGSNWEDIVTDQSKWAPPYSGQFAGFQADYNTAKTSGKSWALLENKVTYPTGISNGSSRNMDQGDVFTSILVTPMHSSAEFIDNNYYGKHLAPIESTWLVILSPVDDCSKGVMVVYANKDGYSGSQNQLLAWDNNNTTWLGGLMDIYPVFINYDISYPTEYEGGLPDTTPLISPRLDYLALGDSYSSGEGDIKKLSDTKSHYLSGTDIKGNYTQNIPEEKCHISDRSYPFLLRKSLGLTSKNMKSIACSGAKRVDVQGYDVVRGTDIYNGQEYTDKNGGRVPRLNPLSGSLRLSLQNSAKTDFLPGRIQQIEFVKKNKPKAITINLGGNDADFGKIIEACIEKVAVGPISTTCDQASEKGRKDLGQLIGNQYNALRDVYTQLKEVSPDSKIYVLGYPQFISTDNYCGDNPSLNTTERFMMVQAVTYMNSVIKAAAASAGVYYVDIENSLNGHRLCDVNISDRYVNGFTTAVVSDKQEAFHPNSKGHKAIFQRLKSGLNNQTLTNFDSCDDNDIIICPEQSSGARPQIPEYFDPPSIEDRIIQGAEMLQSGTNETLGAIKKGSQAVVNLAPLLLQPQSTVTITLHSDPIALGAFMADGNGSLAENISIPTNIPAGFHVLYASGKTYSGEDIEYRQIIEVRGQSDTDIDDNGILDTQQPCGPFLQASNTDADLDGIDDACDPEISAIPQLYRVRQGDVARSYNGSAEHENYLYIERNTRASSITGVSGDDDPDGDGWAIVGASKGTEYTSSTAPDTAPAANFIVTGEGANSKPYVYLRAGGFGCTSFTPSTLAKVQQGQNRTIKKVDYNTDKCRQEEPNDDIDGDGQPDNTQPLYMARNGDAGKGENPDRIYLFRNFYSAEAQLDISDYSSTGTPAGNPDQPIQDWNLLATSKNGEYIPAFNKLVILNPEHTDNNTNKPLPIILTKKQNNQCIAYKPEDTNIIKRDTQKKLIKLTNIPQGTNCE